MKKLFGLFIGGIIGAGLVCEFFALVGWVVEVVANNVHPLILVGGFLALITYALLAEIPEDDEPSLKHDYVNQMVCANWNREVKNNKKN